MVASAIISQAKGKKYLRHCKKEKIKIFFGKKILAANLDDPLAGYFLSFPAARKFGVTFKGVHVPGTTKVFQAALQKNGPPAEFEVQGVNFVLDLPAALM